MSMENDLSSAAVGKKEPGRGRLLSGLRTGEKGRREAEFGAVRLRKREPGKSSRF